MTFHSVHIKSVANQYSGTAEGNTATWPSYKYLISWKAHLVNLISFSFNSLPGNMNGLYYVNHNINLIEVFFPNAIFWFIVYSPNL